jgi:hypothetical protein
LFGNEVDCPPIGLSSPHSFHEMKQYSQLASRGSGENGEWNL